MTRGLAQNEHFGGSSTGPLKYTLQNVVFLSTKKANLLFCEHLWRLLLIYASQPSAQALITSAMQLVNTGVYFPGEYSHNPYFRWKIMADDISIGKAQ